MNHPDPVFFSLPLEGENRLFAEFPFFRDGAVYQPDDGKTPLRCGLTLLDAGSMKMRWDEPNPRRTAFFSSAGIAPERVAAVQLEHSKTVYVVTAPGETEGKTGDGILTAEKRVVPSVTAADCMPIYLHDPVTGFFGVLHSGWKGTGIVLSALELAKATWGASPGSVLAVLGPHINSCCYTVDEERARFFMRNFSGECAFRSEDGTWRLSLAAANRVLLERAGVRNIAIATDCTCCSDFLGSFRRETERISGVESRNFTPMAIYIYYKNI